MVSVKNHFTLSKHYCAWHEVKFFVCNKKENLAVNRLRSDLVIVCLLINSVRQEQSTPLSRRPPASRLQSSRWISRSNPRRNSLLTRSWLCERTSIRMSSTTWTRTWLERNYGSWWSTFLADRWLTLSLRRAWMKDRSRLFAGKYRRVRLSSL